MPKALPGHLDSSRQIRLKAWCQSSKGSDPGRGGPVFIIAVFGIIKEQQGARRFLLRGLANVAAEWTMLATAFNLRTLWRVWRSRLFIDLFRGPEAYSIPDLQ